MEVVKRWKFSLNDEHVEDDEDDENYELDGDGAGSDDEDEEDENAENELIKLLAPQSARLVIIFFII
jgi:hypothetical protein